MKKLFVPLFLIIALLGPAACSKKAAETPSLPAYKIGIDPVGAKIIEGENLNIPYWLEKGALKHVLIRLSGTDGLVPVQPGQLDTLSALKRDKQYQKIYSAGIPPAGEAVYYPANTAYLAEKLGIADEIYWVVPIFGSIDDEQLEGFKKYLKGKMPEKSEEIDAIKINGSVAEGTVNGIPIKILGLEDFPKLDKPALLDIDLSFFSSLYGGEKETPMLKLISGFLETLKNRNISADTVTLSCSNQDGSVPFKFRFIASYLREIFKNPAMINAQPPELWSERAEAWGIEQKNMNSAVLVYKAILKKFPQDAASHYDLSFAYFQLDKNPECINELAEAVKSDTGYAPAYKDYAAMLKSAGRKAEAKLYVAGPSR